MTSLGTLASTAQALGDISRIRIVAGLRGGELCVCQIVVLLGLAPATVSRHLRWLREAGLIECRKQGRWRYYRQADRGAASEVREALHWLDRVAAGDPLVAADEVRLRRLRATDPKELLGCYDCRPRPPSRNRAESRPDVPTHEEIP